MAAEERNSRRTAVGVVLSDKMDKTLLVQSELKRKHPKYGKFVRSYTKYKVHDPKNEGKIGDTVEISESRPISKTKHWRLVRVMQKAEG